MTVWAIADLHLSFSVPNKKMDVFGSHWVDHAQKIEENWLKTVKDGDLVLIPGDISWAMHLEEALVDLQWIDRLPGTKVMLRGNHDYWWTSLKKMNQVVPTSIHLIHNNAFHWQGISVGGSRLWDSSEYSFNSYIEHREQSDQVNQKVKEQQSPEEQEKIFQRELDRLEISLRCLDPQAKTRIAMTHYPPISADLKSSRVSELLEKYGIDICVFGHLHNVRKDGQIFGKKKGITYSLVCCDYLDFKPLKIL